MILRISFNDNDFTQVIEEFLDDCHCDRMCMMMTLSSKYKDDVQQYVQKSKEIMDLGFELNSMDRYNSDQIDKFIKIFRESFLYWISTKKQFEDSESYLKQTLNISCVSNVKSKWHNGEVVYWFTSFGKYITM